MYVAEMFWVELSMHNPLDAEITLSDLTLLVDASEGSSVTIESLSEVVLRPKETRLVCLSAYGAFVTHNAAAASYGSDIPVRRDNHSNPYNIFFPFTPSYH